MLMKDSTTCRAPAMHYQRPESLADSWAGLPRPFSQAASRRRSFPGGWLQASGVCWDIPGWEKGVLQSHNRPGKSSPKPWAWAQLPGAGLCSQRPCSTISFVGLGQSCLEILLWLCNNSQGGYAPQPSSTSLLRRKPSVSQGRPAAVMLRPPEPGWSLSLPHWTSEPGSCFRLLPGLWFSARISCCGGI